MNETLSLKIGTRGSPLALKQTQIAIEAICSTALHLNHTNCEVIPIKTSGDRIQDKTLSEFGGKGLFTKEIDDALLSGAVDFAVHSLKDLPTNLPDGIELVACLEREDARDALISVDYNNIDELPIGAIVGTASLRRGAQILHHRPDITIKPIRGNVETRIRKLSDEDFDATILAYAGLIRNALTEHAKQVFDIDYMLPALCQGIIAITCRRDDNKIKELLSTINHEQSYVCALCERAFLKEIDGSCKTPIAGLARIEGNQINFTGEIYSIDGSKKFSVKKTGNLSDAEAIGSKSATEIKQLAGAEFMVQFCTR